MIIQKTNKISGFVLNSNYPRLLTCLEVLEVRVPRPNGRLSVKDGFRSANIYKWPVQKLWDIWEMAKKNFRRLMMKHHPDKGGDAIKCGNITYAWRYIQKEFSKFGIS